MENSAKIIHDKFLIVTELDSSTLSSLKYYLVKSIGTNKYFALKTLTLSTEGCPTKDENGGKQLIYTEHKILSMLHDIQGVSHEYGIVREDKLIKGKNYKIISLVLDPFTYYYEMPHKDGFGVFINMQHYILGKRTLQQQEALFLFRELCLIVQQLHNKNIIHRDLKLGNILYYKKLNKVVLIHFCLSKALGSSDEELNDQKGSPVYMSPESLSGKSYCGKRSEIWSLGVIFYTLLFGQFPFMDENPQELFRKIKHVAFEPPNKPTVSPETINILKGIFKKEPKQRSKIRDILKDITKALDPRLEKKPSEDDDYSCLVPIDSNYSKPKKFDGIIDSKTLETTVGSAMVTLPRRIEICRYPFSVNYATFNENETIQNDNFEKQLRIGDMLIDDFAKYFETN